VEIEDRTAPSYETLRPLKPQQTPTFPVYHGLSDTLVNASVHPDPTVAHVLATCSSYAYADADTVAMIMARLGLAGNQCRMVSQHVDVMFISSTAYVLQSRDGRAVVLCYRGTIPTSVISWLTDLDVNPQRVPIAFPDSPDTFEVHGGFYRNVRATRHEVIAALDRAVHGHSVLEAGSSVPHQLEVLYITGHSLGAAMASMMAIMLRTEPAYTELAERLRAVYTFGGPMIGSPQLAHACADDPFLCERVIRYVYANDIVPQLPPTATGPFAHFGVEYQYRGEPDNGTWHRNERPRAQLSRLTALVTTPLSFIARQIHLTRELAFSASLYDHLPALYITALTPPGVGTEFGN